jgi:hypothetical protein
MRADQETDVLLAMQKVEGSNPFSRFGRRPAFAGLFASDSLPVRPLPRAPKRHPLRKTAGAASRWRRERRDLQANSSVAEPLTFCVLGRKVRTRVVLGSWSGFRHVVVIALGWAASSHVLTGEVDGPGRLSSWPRPSSGESTAGHRLGRAVRMTGGASRRLRSPTNNRRSDSRCGTGPRPHPRARRSRAVCRRR